MSTLPRETDDELREWMADWQADPEPAPDVREAIRRRVRRQSLKMALTLAGETVLTVGLLAIVIRSAVVWPAPLNVAAMGGLALLILWAMGSSIWYRRGTWRPIAETTSAFLALSILRCHRRLSALRAGWWMLAIELTVLIPWLYFLLSSDPVQKPTAGEYAISFGFLVCLTVVVAGLAIVTHRKIWHELRELEAVREGLDEGFERS